MVLDRQVDVAVAVEYRGARPRRPAPDHVPLYAEPFDAVVPVTHRLADAAEVPLAELAKDPWIGPYPGNPCTTSSSWPARTPASSLVWSTPRTTSARGVLASADVGVAVPRSALHGTDLTGVVVRPVDGVAPTPPRLRRRTPGAEEHPLIRPVLDALGEAARA